MVLHGRSTTLCKVCGKVGHLDGLICFAKYPKWKQIQQQPTHQAIAPSAMPPRQNTPSLVITPNGRLLGRLQVPASIPSKLSSQHCALIQSIPIAWTPVPNGLTLLEIFGGISTGLLIWWLRSASDNVDLNPCTL